MNVISRFLLAYLLLFSSLNAQEQLDCEINDTEYCSDIKAYPYKSNPKILYIANDPSVYYDLYMDKDTKAFAKKLHALLYNLNRSTRGVFDGIKRNYKTLDLELNALRLGSRKSATLKKNIEKAVKSIGVEKFYSYYEDYEDSFAKDMMIANGARGFFYPEIVTDLEELVDELKASRSANTLQINLWFMNDQFALTEANIDIKAKRIGRKYKFQNSKKIKNQIIREVTKLLEGKVEEENTLEEDF